MYRRKRESEQAGGENRKLVRRERDYVVGVREARETD